MYLQDKGNQQLSFSCTVTLVLDEHEFTADFAHT